ncbi:hypothetical protein L9F63_019655, partial [Diploptera punctata]
LEIPPSSTLAVMAGHVQDTRMEKSSVCKFYNGSTVFVTGGTGFLGKLLIEKLMRTCPNTTVYLLIRPKKGKNEKERFEELFVGDVKACPDYKSKIKFVLGDVGQPNLGLSEEDRNMLIREVSVVFHIAATVRFDEKIRSAVHINVRGTRDILELAKNIKQLKAFIHVSSAYANCAYKQIDEQLYETPVTSDQIIELVNLLNEDVLTDITPTLLGKWPNTYAYTKSISEQTVKEHSKDLPVAIVRPAIVIGTAREPFAGWINNVYGPTGVVVGAGIGLLRTMHCDRRVLAEVVPADMVTNMMLVTAWDLANQHKVDKTEEIPIYNYISSTQNPITWEKYMKYNECGKEYPSLSALWYYCFFLNKYRFLHNICTVLLHYLPALIVDTGLRIVGKDPILWNAYKKIHKFVDVISYFSTQQWDFTNNNVQELWKRTDPVDKQQFDFDMAGIDWPVVFRACVQGLRLHLANETPESLPKARKRYQRLKIAHYTLVCMLWMLLFMFLTWIVVTVLS